MNVLDMIATVEEIQEERRKDVLGPLPDGKFITPEWRVEDIKAADFALSRAKDFEAEVREINEQYLQAVAKAEMRRRQLIAESEWALGYFEAHVKRWADSNEGRAALLKGGNRKSRKLLNGTIGWRKKGGRLEVVDREALADWCKDQDVTLDLYRTKVEPNMRQVQAFAKEHQLIPPGCEWVEERDEIYVQVNDDDAVLPAGRELTDGDE